jgi:hypothetical protein
LKKKAIISVKLVEESAINSNETIAEELFSWFLDVLPAPWVKKIDYVVVQEA